jgi:hypothetical protein
LLDQPDRAQRALQQFPRAMDGPLALQRMQIDQQAPVRGVGALHRVHGRQLRSHHLEINACSSAARARVRASALCRSRRVSARIRATSACTAAPASGNSNSSRTRLSSRASTRARDKNVNANLATAILERGAAVCVLADGDHRAVALAALHEVTEQRTRARTLFHASISTMASSGRFTIFHSSRGRLSTSLSVAGDR